MLHVLKRHDGRFEVTPQVPGALFKTAQVRWEDLPESIRVAVDLLRLIDAESGIGSKLAADEWLLEDHCLFAGGAPC